MYNQQKQQEKDDYDDDSFGSGDDGPDQQPTRQAQGKPKVAPQNQQKGMALGKASRDTARTVDRAPATNQGNRKMQAHQQEALDEVPSRAAEQAQAFDIQQAQPVANWHNIMAANDTNKMIIFKFMKKGFTSLSAEELACTMVSSDFSLDFKKNTKEDWMVRYQFKVVERLQKCNFNLKWKTRSSVATAGMGETGAFFDLCKQGDTGNVAKFLRERKDRADHVMGEVDQTNKTGLHHAVENCHPQLVEYLLNKGAKVDARDKMLTTPLHIACLKGYSILVRLLIENKADPFERDFQGRHALHFACCSASENSAQEIFTILSGDSTDLVHMPDHAGRTPLHYATFNMFPGQIRMIQTLLMYGANINCLDENRRTPLHFAAMEGRSSIIPLLVQNGAAAGLKDYQSQTAMDLASSDNIRQQIIVYSPYNKFKPSEEEMKGLEVSGIKKPIKVVENLPPSYYEPYEHAQPAKKKKNFVKINQKAVGEQPQPEEGKPSFTCACQCQPAQVVPPEELCMNCRPLGPSNDWLIQKKTALPYNIRNYQAKLVENLKRVQEFGVESFQHVKKPYLFTGSWMEYVRNLDDLMLQINGVRPNEAVMKVFNILFPYEKPLPRGRGDELGLAGFYADKKEELGDDLKDCHPDKLRDNMMADWTDAEQEAIRKNRVGDVNDLLHLQDQMAVLQTANEISLVTIQQKDDHIRQLQKENAELSASMKIKGNAEVMIIALEEKIYSLENQNKQLESEKGNLTDKVRSLVVELEGSKRNQSNAQADAALYEELLQYKNKIKEMEEKLLIERQKNMQLRLKSGKAFMAALNDPDYAPSGGKIVEEFVDPDDDHALMRLLQKIEEKGEATLEQKLNKFGDINGYINLTQYNNLLDQHQTLTTDYIRMSRIAGFAHMTGKVKKKKVIEVMRRINDRAAMSERIKDETLKHIAIYMDKQEYNINQLFRRFNTDEDDHLSEKEFFEMLELLHINVNRQLKRILYSMFDQDGNGQISKAELTAKLAPYTKKAPITAEQITGNIISQKDKEDFAEMFNEENRTKAVFEDFAFDVSDKDELARREAETIQLIKENKLPEQPIQGEIDIHLRNFENILPIDGKNVVFYKLKFSHFTPEATVAYYKTKGNYLTKHFSWETNTINQKIILDDLFGKNLHMQGDTLLIQLFLCKAKLAGIDKSATPIGEIRFKWKHCCEDDKKNDWHYQQVPLTDEDNKVNRGPNTIISGQINVGVRYLIAGQSNSKLNLDGTLKPKKKKYGALQKAEVKHNLEEQKVGAAGTLHCTPVSAKFTEESKTVFEAEPVKYGVVFATDAVNTTTSDGMEREMDDPLSIFFMDSRQLAVEDSSVPKAVDITIVKITEIGQEDVPIAKGQISAEMMGETLNKVEIRGKSVKLALKNMAGQDCGILKYKIIFTKELLKVEEEKKDDEMVPAGNLAAQ